MRLGWLGGRFRVGIVGLLQLGRLQGLTLVTRFVLCWGLAYFQSSLREELSLCVAILSGLVLLDRSGLQANASLSGEVSICKVYTPLVVEMVTID